MPSRKQPTGVNAYLGGIVDLLQADKVSDQDIVDAFEGLHDAQEWPGSTAAEKVTEIRLRNTDHEVAQVLSTRFSYSF